MHNARGLFVVRAGILLLAAAYLCPSTARAQGRTETWSAPPSRGSAAHGPSIEGSWFLVPSRGGVADNPQYMTLAQDGTDVEARFTCQAEAPVGHGTYDGHELTLAFDFGGGEGARLAGSRHGRTILGTFTAPMGDSGTFTLERTRIDLDCAHACDPVTPVRFVTHDFTNLDKVVEISLFRSSAGHDYSDDCETCRSMKHYYAPSGAYLGSNGLIEVFSPVAGTVVSIAAEGYGASPPGENKQVHIRSTEHPDYTFILFHVDLLPNPISVGDAVAAGQQVGTARMIYPDLGEIAHDFDVAVWVQTLFGSRYVSFVETLTDAVFASYIARGATARSDFVITKAARDADPLTCSNETFLSTGSLPAWFVLSPQKFAPATTAAPVTGVDLELALEGARPNPAVGGRLVAQFVLPSDSAARLELYDVAGRRVVTRDVGSLGPGRHAVDLAQGEPLAAGVYAIRLTQSGHMRVALVAVLN